MPKIAQIVIVLILLSNSFGLIGCSKENNTAYAPAAPTSVSTPASGLIKVELSIPYAPALNQPIDVTCTVSSLYAFTDIIVKITSRRRVTAPIEANIEHPYIAGDNITRTFNLKANQLISFSSKMVFKENGFWRITASVAYAPDADKYWNDAADLYLTINGDQGAIGWSLPGPSIFPEAPPEPPALLPDGTWTPVEKPEDNGK